jgi:hypothetical protein
LESDHSAAREHLRPRHVEGEETACEQQRTHQEPIPYLDALLVNKVYTFLNPLLFDITNSRYVNQHAGWGGADHDVHIQTGLALDFDGNGFDLALGGVGQRAGLGLIGRALVERGAHADGTDGRLAAQGAGNFQRC